MRTVGEILQEEREKQEISLKDVEKSIRVREKFLAAIEKNDWSMFSSKTYVAGIIKNYASFLKLDPDKILAFFRREYELKEEGAFKRRISSKYLTPQTKKYITSVIVLIFLLFISYFGYQIHLFLTPPKVEILSPKETKFRKEEKITIVGKTEREAAVSIFQERVYPNSEGVFTYVFPLSAGKNILVIEVVGGNGKKTVVRKEFFLAP